MFDFALYNLSFELHDLIYMDNKVGKAPFDPYFTQSGCLGN